MTRGAEDGGWADGARLVVVKLDVMNFPSAEGSPSSPPEPPSSFLLDLLDVPTPTQRHIYK
jgi:hypothetical protein